MRLIADEMGKKGFTCTWENGDDKGKSLLNDFRSVEDDNSKSGNGTCHPKGEGIHEQMADISGSSAIDVLWPQLDLP